MKAILFILPILFLQLYAHSQIQINEIMSANDDIIFDEDGDTPDWIELYNSSDTTICLDQWHLSDNFDQRTKWRLHDTCIQAHSYILIWASGKSRSGNSLHTNFRLRGSGENLILSDPAGRLIERMIFPPLEDNVSYGKARDGSLNATLLSPSPGHPNSAAADYGDLLIRFETDTFFYKDNLLINIQASDSCEQLQANLEGRIASGQKTRGNSLNVELNDQNTLNPYYALFPTIENFRPPARLMKFPHVGITCLDDSGRILSFKDQTFVDRTILQRKVDLPVVLIESQEDNLFNEDFGIMVPGENENFKQEGRDWERPARILLYNDDEILLDAEVGIRIHGHATRDLPQKSLKVYFRPKYDSLKFPGHFLNRDHDLNRVLVRSFHSDFIGNEFTDFGFRDDLVMRIIGEENLVYGQRSRPCVVFLNGEYWGIYSLHEATDDDFIAGIEDLTADEITLLSGPESGYFASRPVRHLDLDDAMERRRFEQFYDFENLVDYFLFQTFFANTDWPHNNIKFWHKTNTDLPYKFILFDMDATFKFPGQNPFTRLNSEAGFTSRYPSKYYQLYDVLLNSDHFIQSLRKRYFDLRNDLLAPERMLGLAREWKESIEPHILDQKERWHYPRRKRDWEKSFEEIEHFIVTRQLHFDQFINDLTPSVIFPNPSSTGILQLKESDKTHYSSVAVFDLTGMKLFESDIQEGSFDLSDLSGRGMVIVKLYGNFGSRVERVLLP